MVKQLFKILVLGGLLGCFADQVALAQYRGSGNRENDDDDRRRRFEEWRSRGGFSGFGGSSRNDDDDRRRRFEEMRSRGGFGGWGSSRSGDNDNDRSRGFGGSWGRSGGGDDGRSRSDRSRSSDNSRSRDGRNNGQPAPYVPAPQAPIIVELSSNYTEGDRDGDGQLTLFEWRQWKPQEIARFMAMDSNNDGFLTAREVIIAENFPNETPAAESTTTHASASAPPGPSAAPEPTRQDADGNPTGGNTGEKASAAEARFVFGVLDKSRDGMISAEEWTQSKSVREGFTKAGITLKVPADRETFLSQYPPYRIVPRLTLPSN